MTKNVPKSFIYLEYKITNVVSCTIAQYRKQVQLHLQSFLLRTINKTAGHIFCMISKDNLFLV